MKETRLIMGMPVTVEIVDSSAPLVDINRVFAYFHKIDEQFSTYQPTSEISRINSGEIQLGDASPRMKEIFALAEKTKQETRGFFDIDNGRILDPSGVVKGWAIERAGELLRAAGRQHYYIEAGGDITIAGNNAEGVPWQVGIRHPFDLPKIVKVLSVTNCGVATSGTYLRGQHVYNPHHRGEPIVNIVSLTVIGPNICDADRYATGALAMDRAGIAFIDSLPGFEGYMIDRYGVATMTRDFEQYCLPTTA